MNEQVKNGKKSWVRIILLVILIGLGAVSYIQLSLNYRKMEKSNHIIQALLDYQMGLTRQYAKELEKYKENLNQFKINLKNTEEMLGEIQQENSIIREENSKLREKLVLLDKMSELENTIAKLKEENSRITQLMEERKKADPEEILKNLETVDQGKELLAKHIDFLKRIKFRINDFRHDEKLQRVAAQRERDRVLLLMGNNGYLVRNGEITPVEIPQIPASANVNIDVQFVK